MSVAAAASPASLSDAQVERYSRQIILREIGALGQQRLLAAAVALTGSSAVTTAAARYLAAAGVGRLGLADLSVAPHPKLNPETRCEKLRIDIGSFAVIIDAGSIDAERDALNRIALVQRRPLVRAVACRALGYLTTLIGPRAEAPCAHCLADPALAGAPEDTLADTTASLIGTLAAVEAIKCILDLGTPLYGRALIYDVRGTVFEMRVVTKNPACPVCRVEP